MSTDFSANQYENGYFPHKLQNWQIPKGETKRPNNHEGFTQTIANNRGHLLPGVPRSRESPWGSFVSTWDMPDKLPRPTLVNPTARSDCAVDRLEQEKFNKEMVIHGKLKQCKLPPPLKVKEDVEATLAADPLPPVMTMGPPPTLMESGRQAPPPDQTAPPRVGTGNSIHWPKPGESGTLAAVPPETLSPKAATPKVATPKPPTPKAATPKIPTPAPECVQQELGEPELQKIAGQSPAAEPVEWPMPRSVEPPQV